MEAQNALVRAIKFLRDHHSENLELEIRVGHFSADNDFVAGINHKHLKTNLRLLTRIEKNATVLKQWKLQEDLFTMMRFEYDGGVRKTCRVKTDNPPDYIAKRVLKKIDIVTNRPFHFRLAISRETRLHITPSHHMYETVTKKPPLSVRIIQRKSFLETVPNETNSFLGTKDNLPFQFQWDLSKVSPPAATKQQATTEPAVYQVEFELKSQLIPIPDSAQEQTCNELLARLIMERIYATSGTHVIKKIENIQKDIQNPSIQKPEIESPITFERLPRTPLVLLSSDV